MGQALRNVSKRLCVNAKQIWQTTLERLQTKVQSAVFTTWFQCTSAHSFQDGIFTVYVPTTFAKAHLEGRFVETIRSILADTTDIKVEVQFVRDKNDAPQQGESLLDESIPAPTRRPYRLPLNFLECFVHKRQLHSFPTCRLPTSSP